MFGRTNGTAQPNGAVLASGAVGTRGGAAEGIAANDLRWFRIIAEAGSISEAARRHDASKATPSRAVGTLDGGKVRLSGHLRDRPLVLETGSVTCPTYGASVDPMQNLAAKQPGLDSIVMYVREAHPGERVGAHADLAVKIEAARSARERHGERHGERRTVLVDDVEGSAQALYGSMPNSTFVIDSDSTVLCRTMWNNAGEMDAILDDVARGRSVRPRDLKPKPPFTLAAMRTLLIGGWHAMADFQAGLVPLVGKHRKKGMM